MSLQEFAAITDGEDSQGWASISGESQAQEVLSEDPMDTYEPGKRKANADLKLQARRWCLTTANIYKTPEEVKELIDEYTKGEDPLITDYVIGVSHTSKTKKYMHAHHYMRFKMPN